VLIASSTRRISVWRRIPAKAAQRMKELLQSVQAPVAGFVLNDRTALISGTYGYGKGYYGRNSYGYEYYGADDQKESKTGKTWWRKLLMRG
jgi:Mrp family chromosome partitioning ATPase